MKGQTTVEALLVIVIIVIVSVFIMNYYNDETIKTTSFAIVRSDVDKFLSSAKLSGCRGELVHIIDSVSGSHITYNITVTNCADYVNTTDIVKDIYISLGCNDINKACKGYIFEVNVS